MGYHWRNRRRHKTPRNFFQHRVKRLAGILCSRGWCWDRAEAYAFKYYIEREPDVVSGKNKPAEPQAELQG